MTENFSERRIKEALENLEVPYEPATWDLLEQKLNAPFLEENPPAVEPVDKIVYPTLTRLEPVFQEKHWQLMAARLRLIAIRRRQIASSKLIEAAIFLLLFVNLPGWLGIFPSKTQPNFYPFNPAVAEISDPTRPSHSHSNFSKNNPTQAENFAASDFLLKNEEAAAAPISENTTSNFSEKTDDSFFQNFFETRDDDDQSSFLKKLFVEPLSRAIENYFFDSSKQPTEQKPLLPVAEIPAAENPFNNKMAIENRETQSKLADFSILEKHTATMPTTAAKPFLPLSFFYEKPSTRRFQIGIFGGPTINYVKTPASSETAPTARQLVGGYGGGLQFGSKTDARVGFRTGVSYASVNYLRSEIDIFGSLRDGYTKQEIDRVELDLLTVPLHATMKIGRFRHTTLSAAAGFSATVVAQKNLIRRFIQIPNTSGVVNHNGPSALIRYDQSEQKGLFESGGTLAQNFMVSADAALRLERPITPSLSLFFQPTVQKVLNPNGFGKKNDRFTTFSLNAGVTATL